jgi:hypothetical protein
MWFWWPTVFYINNSRHQIFRAQDNYRSTEKLQQSAYFQTTKEYNKCITKQKRETSQQTLQSRLERKQEKAIPDSIRRKYLSDAAKYSLTDSYDTVTSPITACIALNIFSISRPCSNSNFLAATSSHVPPFSGTWKLTASFAILCYLIGLATSNTSLWPFGVICLYFLSFLATRFMVWYSVVIVFGFPFVWSEYFGMRIFFAFPDWVCDQAACHLHDGWIFTAPSSVLALTSLVNVSWNYLLRYCYAILRLSGLKTTVVFVFLQVHEK